MHFVRLPGCLSQLYGYQESDSNTLNTPPPNQTFTWGDCQSPRQLRLTAWFSFSAIRKELIPGSSRLLFSSSLQVSCHCPNPVSSVTVSQLLDSRVTRVSGDASHRKQRSSLYIVHTRLTCLHCACLELVCGVYAGRTKVLLRRQLRRHFTTTTVL